MRANCFRTHPDGMVQQGRTRRNPEAIINGLGRATGGAPPLYCELSPGCFGETFTPNSILRTSTRFDAKAQRKRHGSDRESPSRADIGSEAFDTEPILSKSKAVAYRVANTGECGVSADRYFWLNAAVIDGAPLPYEARLSFPFSREIVEQLGDCLPKGAASAPMGWCSS